MKAYVSPVKCSVKTEALNVSLAQRIKGILPWKGALEAILSISIIAHMGKRRPLGEVLYHVAG